MGDYVERYLFTKDGEELCLVIEPDPDAESPRDWGNMGHMYCWHSRYNLGDDNPYSTPEEFLEDIADITGFVPSGYSQTLSCVAEIVA